MTKLTLRRLFVKAFREVFVIRPKGKWDTIARIWDKAIWGGYTTIVFFTALVTNNMGTILLLLWVAVGGFIIFYYFIAKGK